MSVGPPARSSEERPPLVATVVVVAAPSSTSNPPALVEFTPQKIITFFWGYIEERSSVARMNILILSHRE